MRPAPGTTGVGLRCAAYACASAYDCSRFGVAAMLVRPVPDGLRSRRAVLPLVSEGTMSSVRLSRPGLPRWTARLAVAAGVVLAATLLPVSAAFADVDLKIEELPRSLTPGDAGGSFEAIVNNNDRDDYPAVRFVFTVQMERLRASHVQITRGGQPLSITPGSGTVRFTDQNAFPLRSDSDHSQTYEISFLAGSPDGRASLFVDAVGARADRGGVRSL